MMRRFLQIVTTVSLLLVAAEKAVGFSLIGPNPPWQTAALAFQIPGNTFAGNGGPMNINEEYRWNVPTIHYGYSAEFLSYFGQDGVDSIEEAVEILNDVPSVDNLEIDDYQTESGRFNLRAAALGLTDLKSVALSSMLQARGLADPTRYSFVIRNRWVVNNVTNYLVTKRNFDPETLQHSSFVNGSLWSYIIQDPVPPLNYAWASNFPVDPLERLLPRTLPVAGIDSYGIATGFFWTQLTRDDVGGLKHIYRSSNFNTETTLADVTGPGGGVAGGVAGGGAAGAPVGFPGGGGTFDFPSAVTGAGGGTFDFPFGAATTVPVGGQAAGGVGAGAAVGAPVGPSLRGGISRIQMVRSDYDSLVGVFFNPLTERFTETVRTNGRPRSQSLTRTVLAPDIIFDAADLQQGDATVGDDIVTFTTTGATGWSSSDALDGVTGDDFGPGVIVPSFRITFNTVGPAFLNLQSANSFFLTEGSLSAQSQLTWGSFDGSTNDPIAYPVGTSILELERRVR
jgi:hypothetical protein